ncbi:hypothetical protein N9O57_01025 [bacterium]|nr:hypothetical protein [bacterium]
MELKKLISGPKGLSLIETMMSVGLLGGILLAANYFMSKPEQDFQDIQNKFTAMNDENFLLKSLERKISGSYILKGGIFSCEEKTTTLSSQIENYQGPLITLDKANDSFSLITAKNKDVGVYQIESLGEYNNLVVQINYFKDQIKLKLNGRSKSSLDPTTDAAIIAMINRYEIAMEDAQDKMDAISLDPTGETRIGVMNPGFYLPGNLIMISKLNDPGMAGLYYVTKVDANLSSISVEEAGRVSLDHFNCEVKGQQMVGTIVRSSARDLSLGTTSFNVSIIEASKYYIEEFNDEFGRLMLDTYPHNGKMRTQLVETRLKKLTFQEKWEFTGELSQDIEKQRHSIAGLMEAEVKLERYFLKLKQKVLTRSNIKGGYNLKSSLRMNGSVATTPRPSLPVEPEAYATVQQYLQGKKCSSPVRNKPKRLQIEQEVDDVPTYICKHCLRSASAISSPQCQEILNRNVTGTPGQGTDFIFSPEYPLSSIPSLSATYYNTNRTIKGYKVLSHPHGTKKKILFKVKQNGSNYTCPYQTLSFVKSSDEEPIVISRTYAMPSGEVYMNPTGGNDLLKCKNPNQLQQFFALRIVPNNFTGNNGNVTYIAKSKNTGEKFNCWQKHQKNQKHDDKIFSLSDIPFFNSNEGSLATGADPLIVARDGGKDDFIIYCEFGNVSASAKHEVRIIARWYDVNIQLMKSKVITKDLKVNLLRPDSSSFSYSPNSNPKCSKDGKTINAPRLNLSIGKTIKLYPINCRFNNGSWGDCDLSQIDINNSNLTHVRFGPTLNGISQKEIACN